MATKRKPKPEPILNAEPLKSDGVIVTHPERHITPGNASIVWLIVMMAIIGGVGAICTTIWWQKEDLAAQIEAPYMHDNSRFLSRFVRDMRNRVTSQPEPKPVMEILGGIGQFPFGYELSYPQSLDVLINIPGTNPGFYSVSWYHGPIIFSELSRQESIWMNLQPADPKINIDSFITKRFGSKVTVEDLRTPQGLVWKQVTINEPKQELWQPSHAFVLTYKDKDGKEHWLVLEVNKLSADLDLPIAEAIVQSLKLTDGSTQ